MLIGRKIYYILSTGEVLFPPLETRDGGIPTTKEADMLAYPQLKGIDPTTIDFIQLAFNEREQEIQTMGSCHIDPLTTVLTIYPKLSISTDKAQITSDGVDTATIIATLADNTSTETLTLTVDDGTNPSTDYPISCVAGVATFGFSSTLAGTYTVTAKSTLYGQNSVSMEVV